MMNTQPYYPVGIQDFKDIRSLNAVYVDKTALVYQLTHQGNRIKMIYALCLVATNAPRGAYYG
jgi:hypothetical protein